LLKVLEEPLQRRMIIATCSHPNQLLPTIYSRALIFSFNTLSESEMSDYITSESVFASYDKEFLMSLAGGRP
jgi:DNA polymerase-3 subunit delta'